MVNVDLPRLENLGHTPMQQIEFEQGCRTQSVDQHRNPVTRVQSQLAQNGMQQAVGDSIGSLGRNTGDTWFSMNAHADFHLAIRYFKIGLAGLRHGTGRQRDAHRPGRIIGALGGCFNSLQGGAHISRCTGNLEHKEIAGNATPFVDLVPGR